MKYLSLACIAKNEDLYLEEWVNFHRAVGVEHFYIYDNDSTVPIKNLLSKYIEHGIVTVIDFPGKLKQHASYKHCLDNFSNQSQWIGFLDCDEFLVPKSKDTVVEILGEYQQHGGLVVNWLFFGNGGHITRPEGLVTENFIMSSHRDWCTNRHIKSIVQTKYTLDIGGDPHCFKYKPPFYAVTEDNKRVDGTVVFQCKSCSTVGVPEAHHAGEISTEKIQVHHYYTKSEEEFLIRYKGGSGWSPEPTRSNMGAFHSVNRICNIENKSALRFVEKAKSLYIK